jgi:hypothetical protein
MQITEIAMAKKLSPFVVCCILLCGCATIRTPEAFNNASAGMSKADVIKSVGPPAIVRGIIKNKDCDTVEVWEYKAGKGKNFQQVTSDAVFTFMSAGSGAALLLSAAQTDRYWVYFVNGKFAGWSLAGDWSRDSDKLYEMKFAPDKSISKMI